MYAKKSLGQNFLISPRIVGAIVGAADLKPGETVVEIGPGKGVLTKAILETGAEVVAIEKDTRLIPTLGEIFKKEIENKKLELVHGDILEMDVENFDLGEYKLIANIPYYITGALIQKFLSGKSKPSECVFMVQKEVAERIIARDKKESILSLSVKVFADPSLVMNVSRGNFFPIPNVDSTVIKLSNIKKPFENPGGEARFFEIVKAGFAQKRKKLISNLEKVIPKEKLKEIFEKLKLEENTRAEDVPLETWVGIMRA